MTDMNKINVEALDNATSGASRAAKFNICWRGGQMGTSLIDMTTGIITMYGEDTCSEIHAAYGGKNYYESRTGAHGSGYITRTSDLLIVPSFREEEFLHNAEIGLVLEDGRKEGEAAAEQADRNSKNPLKKLLMIPGWGDYELYYGNRGTVVVVFPENREVIYFADQSLFRAWTRKGDKPTFKKHNLRDQIRKCGFECEDYCYYVARVGSVNKKAPQPIAFLSAGGCCAEKLADILMNVGVTHRYTHRFYADELLSYLNLYTFERGGKEFIGPMMEVRVAKRFRLLRRGTEDLMKHTFIPYAGMMYENEEEIWENIPEILKLNGYRGVYHDAEGVSVYTHPSRGRIPRRSGFDKGEDILVFSEKNHKISRMQSREVYDRKKGWHIATIKEIADGFKRA